MRLPPLVFASTLLMAAASSPASLVQNEYDFAATVAKQGIRDGFLQYLDKQAIGFSPTPASAYDAYSARKPGPSKGKLSWYPVYAILSASGDFGVDTGPWTYDATGKDGKPVQAHGEWLTVWHRNQEGQWKALFDGGIGHAATSAEKPLAPDAEVTHLPPSGGPASAAKAAYGELEQAEAAFSDAAARRGLRQAYQDAAAPDLRLLQDKSPPFLGRASAVRAVADVPSGLVWTPMGGSAARSGDLGFVYGETYKLGDAKHTSPVGVYMHVWRRQAEGWKLLIAEDVPL